MSTKRRVYSVLDYKCEKKSYCVLLTLGYLVWRSPIVILLYNLSWSRPSTLVAYEFRTNVQYYCMHDQNPQVP